MVKIAYESESDPAPKAISIFSMTRSEYAQEVVDRLGRGRGYAEKIYGRFFRSGRLEPDEELSSWVPEASALPLVKRIRAMTNFRPEGKVSKDTKEHSTSKFLLEFEDGLVAESVEIPMDTMTTLCISSQVGCKMGCTFCETGRMGLLRSLKAAEIVSQVFHSRHVRNCSVRNIVFMGMGEPFDNFDNVSQAIKILTERSGLNFGASNITVSTVGRVDEIYRMVDEFDPGVRLAVSLNSSHDAARGQVMPINNTHNMGELKDAMKAYCAVKKRKILIEYVMMDGVNDSLEDAERVSVYLQGVGVQAVNLIPYNSQSGIAKFQPSPDAVIDAFSDYLQKDGYFVTIRRPKGRDIMAACGQLGNLHMKKEAKQKARAKQQELQQRQSERVDGGQGIGQGSGGMSKVTVLFGVVLTVLAILWVRALSRRGVISLPLQ